MKKISLLVVLVWVTKSSIAQKDIVCLSQMYQTKKSFDTSRFTQNYAGLADHGYLWDNGKTLYIKFLNGSKSLQQKIKAIAKQWEQNANIHFDFVENGLSNIRIQFTGDRYISSAIGTLANMHSQDEATMVMDTTTFSNRQSINSTVLHLFGHVLGLHDEIYVPRNGIKWNEKELKKFLTNIKAGNALQHKDAFMSKYSINNPNALKYDAESIMVSPFDKQLSLNYPTSKWNIGLSIADKKLIEKNYPKVFNKKDSIVIPSFQFIDLKIIKTERGLSVYPSFNLTNKFSGNALHFFVVLVNKYGDPIKAVSEEYNISNQVGAYHEQMLTIHDAQNVNGKQLTDLELFIPLSIINEIDKTKGVFTIFKVYYKNADTQGWLYISKPFEVKL